MSDVFVAPGAKVDTSDERAVTAAADRTLKGDVFAELKTKVTRKTVTLAVPDRPGYSVDYDPKLDADLMKLWTRNASAGGELDPFELALYVLAGQCRGIRREGELVELDGETLTFDSPVFRDMYNALDVTVVVREFYGADIAIGSTFARLQQEAEAGSLDPTTASPA